jgi:hypothetical protein
MANDCWVVLFQQVFDLTRLVQANIASPLVEPLKRRAGKSLNHWFNPKTREPRECIDPGTGARTFYTPDGPFLHLQRDELTVPWWKDEDYYIGDLTERVRTIRIYNMLIEEATLLDVPSE